MHVSPRRRLAATLITGAGLLAAATPAAAYQTGSAKLDFASVNNFGGAAGTTWLGYLSTLAGGGASPIAPATGPAVTPASPKATTFTWSFGLDAAKGGSYDAATGDADVELAGGLDYDGAAHGIDMTLESPRIVIDGDTKTGQLFASGRKSGSMAGGGGGSYDRTKPVFDLDLSAATTTVADGVTTISGIAPEVHEGGYAYPDTYATGAGPDRNPNTFGTLTLTVSEAAVPTVAVDRLSDLDAAGDTVRVTGSGFKTATPDQADNAGLYVALVGPGFSSADPAAPTGGRAFVPQAQLNAAGGAIDVPLPVTGRFGTTDCRAASCAIRVWKAHRDGDATQRVSIPVTFKAAPVAPPQGTPVTPGTTAPAPVVTPAPTATPDAATPAPKVSKAKVAGRKRLTFRVSAPGTVTATVQRQVARRVKGKRVLRWRTVRTLERDVRKAGTVRLNPKLAGKGRFRVVLRTVSTTGAKGKPVVVSKRFK